MALSRIFHPGFFSTLSICEFSISNEHIYHLSPLNFDGEDGKSITEHIFYILIFSESYKIDDEEFSSMLFSLTLEGHTKQWCHMLPAVSIHSFEKLVYKLQQALDMYNFQDLLKRINELRMKLEESLEDFSFRYVHIYFEFPESDVDLVYLNINFQWFILVSL